MPMDSASFMFSSSVLRTSLLVRSFSILATSRPASLAAAEQLLMKVEIFLAGRILHPHSNADLGSFDRACAQHRKFLEHDLQLRIVLHQLHHVQHRALAAAAIV